MEWMKQSGTAALTDGIKSSWETKVATLGNLGINTAAKRATRDLPTLTQAAAAIQETEF